LFFLNFYSNSDFYINVYLASLVFAGGAYIVHVLFETRRTAFFYIVTAVFSLVINMNIMPITEAIDYYLYTLLLLPFFWGEVNHRIVTNFLAGGLFTLLIISGIFSIYRYIDRGDFSGQTIFRKKAEDVVGDVVDKLQGVKSPGGGGSGKSP